MSEGTDSVPFPVPWKPKEALPPAAKEPFQPASDAATTVPSWVSALFQELASQPSAAAAAAGGPG